MHGEREDECTLTYKADWVAKNGYHGVMIWEISSDQSANKEFPLLNAISLAMQGKPMDVKSCPRHGGTLEPDFTKVAPSVCAGTTKAPTKAGTKASTSAGTPSSSPSNSGGNTGGGGSGGGNSGGGNSGGGSGSGSGSCGCSGGSCSGGPRTVTT